MANVGIASFSNAVLKPDGTTPATQAGSHPYEMVTNVSFATDSSGAADRQRQGREGGLAAGADRQPDRDSEVPDRQLNNSGGFDWGGRTGCPRRLAGRPADRGSNPGRRQRISVPLYNVVPPAGKPAQFGANILVANSFLDVTVNTGTDYGLTTTSSNISPLLPLVGIKVTLWGVPADPSHDADRILRGRHDARARQVRRMTPLLTLPTTCTGPLTDDPERGRVGQPAGRLRDTSTSTMPAMTGLQRAFVQPLDHGSAGHDRRGFAVGAGRRSARSAGSE